MKNILLATALIFVGVAANADLCQDIADYGSIVQDAKEDGFTQEDMYRVANSAAHGNQEDEALFRSITDMVYVSHFPSVEYAHNFLLRFCRENSGG